MNQVTKQIIFTLGILALSGGAMALLATSTQNSTAVISEAVGEVLPPGRTWGPETASVSIVEYSDFECPACAAYEPLIKKMLEEFDGKVRFTYRYFPLRQIHPNAQLTAQAAQAASLQGKFWEMHDKLFAEQRAWAGKSDARGLILGYASELGLDLVRFEADLLSDTVKGAVGDDYDRGVRIGIQGTPTFFINGKNMPNPGSYEELRAAVQQSIDAK